MLRRRIEKLERLRPLAAVDLMNRWEQQAMATLSPEDQALVRASFAKTGQSKRPNTGAEIAAMTGYENALSESIRALSDEELDRTIEALEGPGIVTQVTA